MPRRTPSAEPPVSPLRAARTFHPEPSNDPTPPTDPAVIATLETWVSPHGHTYWAAPAAAAGWRRLWHMLLGRHATGDFACYERADGASVRYDSGYDAKPWLASHRGYVAFAPDGSPLTATPRVTRRGQSRVRQLRRWRSADAAIAALDREVPGTRSRR